MASRPDIRQTLDNRKTDIVQMSTNLLNEQRLNVAETFISSVKLIDKLTVWEKRSPSVVGKIASDNVI